MQENKLIEARAELRKYAILLGLCGNCKFYKSINGVVYCERCKSSLDKAKLKQRNNPLNCSRCGGLNDSLSYKTCNRCRLNSNKSKK